MARGLGFDESDDGANTSPPSKPNPRLIAEARDERARKPLSNYLRTSDSNEGETAGWQKPAVDFSATICASTAGTVFWAIASRSQLGLPAKIVGTTLVSGATRACFQTGIERLVLPESQRSSIASNFAWGMVDGAAAVVGSAAESAAGKAELRRIGTSYLGKVSTELAELSGRKAVESSLISRFDYNVIRGAAGGAAGSLVWSIPHELVSHKDNLDTAEGILSVGAGILTDTAIGTVTGGVLAGGLTALGNVREIAGHVSARIRGNKNVTTFDILHFNDLHSSLVGESATLPQLATKIEELRGAAARKGRTALLFDAGDNYSGNVAAGFTKTGYVETKAINMLHPDGFVPGNHVADGGGVTAWVENTHQIARELGRELPAICANIEVPGHPGFSGPAGTVYRPYRIAQVLKPNGTIDRVGVLGLTTKELAESVEHGQLRYLDAHTEARRWIGHMTNPVSLGGEGVSGVIVNSHLGRAEDILLAQRVKGISYIVSAHSHDAEPVLLWVRNAQSGWDVPIMQAGCKGRYLAQSTIALKPNGAADRYRSSGRLLPIDSSIVPHAAIKRFVDAHLHPVSLLEAERYSTPVVSEFSMNGLRGQKLAQTELGTFAAQSILEGVNRNLAELNAERATQGLTQIRPMNIMLEHTGGIRSGLEQGLQTRRSLADMMIHSGGELERKELISATLTGAELSRVLNFGVADMPQPVHIRGQQRGLSGLWRATREIFFGTPPEPLHDFSGNFLQTDGLKYSIDLSKPIGSRISNILVRTAEGREFVPIDFAGRYDVLCRLHPLLKWNKNGAFGTSLQQAGKEAIHAHAEIKPIPLSQVDMLAERLNRRLSLSPADYISDNITNLTPPRWESIVRPRISTIGSLAFQPYWDLRTSSTR